MGHPPGEAEYRSFSGSYEERLQIVSMIEKDLSEPYSVFTYHYFLTQFPHLCWTAWDKNTLVGVAIGKTGPHRGRHRGYIGMLVVTFRCRGRGIGLGLAHKLIEAMIFEGVEEIVLETEATNRASLGLYARLGFIREKRLLNYYLNGSDAFRLKLWIH